MNSDGSAKPSDGLSHSDLVDLFVDEWEADSSLDIGDFCRRHADEDSDLVSTLEDCLFVMENLRAAGKDVHETRMGGCTRRRNPVPSAALGGYRLVRRLGEGGMGTVFLAEQDKPVHRLVALKLIKPGMDSQQVLRRFEAERQALAMMQHSHIARVFDAGTDAAGRPFFVMEYVEGAALDVYCSSRSLGLDERIRLFCQVCSGVQHAHQKGILHRDLKPSNVLVTEQDGKAHAKIIDFGLARAMDTEELGQTHVTVDGQVLGTPEYMSPEQARQAGEDIDSRTDIYSLGVMLYQILTGSLPVSTEVLRHSGMMEMRRKIIEDECEAPSSRLGRAASSLEGDARTCMAWRGRLRGDLDWITMKALEKDRERRYESAAALADDLWRFLDHEPVLAGPPSGIYRIKKMVRKHRLLFGSVSAIIMSLAVAVVFMIFAYAEVAAKEQVAQANVVAMEQVIGTLERLTAMHEGDARHGDFLLDGWDSSFDREEERGHWNERTKRYDPPFYDPKLPPVYGNSSTWFKASSSKELYLDDICRTDPGNLWLGIGGDLKLQDGAVISRWVDARHHGYISDFTLRFQILHTGGERAGFHLMLRSRHVWQNKLSIGKAQPVSGRTLLACQSNKGDPGRGIPGITLQAGMENPQWTPLPLKTPQTIVIRYQRLASGAVRITGSLGGSQLPSSPDWDPTEREEELQMIHLGGLGDPVWIDKMQLRRTLPHDPWMQSLLDKNFYMVTPRPMTFAQARAYALTRGGDLAVLTSVEQRSWIVDTFGRCNLLLGAQWIADSGQGSWRWVTQLPVPESWWREGKIPDDPQLTSAAFGDYGFRNPDVCDRDGALFAVRAERALPALMVFPSRPSRSSPDSGPLVGPLGGDLERAQSAGGRPDLVEDHHTASVVADTDPGNPGGYVLSGNLVGSAVIGRSAQGESGEAVVGTSAGQTDVFVAKCDAQGRILWARLFGGPKADYGAGLAVDDEGRVFVAGCFRGRAGLRKAKAATIDDMEPILESRGEGDIFVLCLGRNGEALWVKRLGNGGRERPMGLACTGTGSLYITGTLEGGTLVSSAAGDLREDPWDSLPPSRGGKDIFLASMDPKGNVRWVRREGGSGLDVAHAVAARPDGGAVITGAFSGQMTFGDAGTSHSVQATSDAKLKDGVAGNLYVASYDARGKLDWCRYHGGPGGATAGYALTVDPSGAVYATGSVHQAVFLGDQAGDFSSMKKLHTALSEEIRLGADPESARKARRLLWHIGSSGWVDAFLVKYDRRGVVQWATTAVGADQRNIGYGLDWSPDGSVLMTGRIQGTCAFGQGSPYRTIRSSYTPDRPDVFFARYDANTGDFRWARSARGPGANWGTDVAALSKEKAVVVGGFQGPINFGEGEPKATTLMGGAIFMASFRLQGGEPSTGR